MAIAAGQFDRIAETVSDRASELLGTSVSVVDTRGTVVASSEASLVGCSLEADGDSHPRNYSRVPLHLDGQSGEVVIAEPMTGEAISPRLAHVLTELVIAQAAVVDRLPNQHELKNKFIHDLLHDASHDEAAVFREAQILGMDLTYPRVVILIDASEYILAPERAGLLDTSDVGLRRRSQLVIASVVDFFELPNDTICAHIGNGEVAVLKACDHITWVDQDDVPARSNPWANLSALKQAGSALLTRLRRTTHKPVTVGIGRYHPGLSGLSASYADARAALSLGQRFHGKNRVHCLNELGIAAFVGVSDERTKIDLARYLLSPLDHEPELLATVDAFLDRDCRPSETSQVLNIHRNTLSYRLNKISHLTGLDPRRFDDAVQIRIALLLRSLSADSQNFSAGRRGSASDASGSSSAIL